MGVVMKTHQINGYCHESSLNPMDLAIKAYQNQWVLPRRLTKTNVSKVSSKPMGIAMKVKIQGLAIKDHKKQLFVS